MKKETKVNMICNFILILLPFISNYFIFSFFQFKLHGANPLNWSNYMKYTFIVCVCFCSIVLRILYKINENDNTE